MVGWRRVRHAAHAGDEADHSCPTHWIDKLLMAMFFCLAMASQSGPVLANGVAPKPLVAAADPTLRQKLGNWRLSVVTSRFSGDVWCVLRSNDNKVIYAQNAVGFRFNHRANTMRAWIKIGAEPAVRWRDMLPELAAQRISITGKNLDAPTDGIIWLPVAQLQHADEVAIQLLPDKPVKVFRMNGFVKMLEAGRKLGCTPDTRFVL